MDKKEQNIELKKIRELMILLSILLIIIISFCIYFVVDKANQVNKETNKDQEQINKVEKPNNDEKETIENSTTEEDGDSEADKNDNFMPDIDTYAKTKKLLEITLKHVNSVETLNDGALYFIMMSYFEEVGGPKFSNADGGYEMFVLKSDFENALHVLNKEKNVADILRFQTHETYNYFNFRVTENEKEYIINGSGHGLDTTVARLIDTKRIKDGYQLTYILNCSSENFDQKYDFAKRVAYLKYDYEDLNFYLEKIVNEPLMENVICGQT